MGGGGGEMAGREIERGEGGEREGKGGERERSWRK